MMFILYQIMIINKNGVNINHKNNNIHIEIDNYLIKPNIPTSLSHEIDDINNE